VEVSVIQFTDTFEVVERVIEAIPILVVDLVARWNRSISLLPDFLMKHSDPLFP
jgi:hypothetical protein